MIQVAEISIKAGFQKGVAISELPQRPESLQATSLPLPNRSLAALPVVRF